MFIPFFIRFFYKITVPEAMHYKIACASAKRKKAVTMFPEGFEKPIDVATSVLVRLI